jgi:hypothetical protein
VVQQIMDMCEPSFFISGISNQPFPDSPHHRVSGTCKATCPHAPPDDRSCVCVQILVHYALGDAQVSWLGAHMLSRSINASMFESNVREDGEELFGFPMLAGESRLE